MVFSDWKSYLDNRRNRRENPLLPGKRYFFLQQIIKFIIEITTDTIVHVCHRLLIINAKRNLANQIKLRKLHKRIRLNKHLPP